MDELYKVAEDTKNKNMKLHKAVKFFSETIEIIKEINSAAMYLKDEISLASANDEISDAQQRINDQSKEYLDIRAGLIAK